MHIYIVIYVITYLYIYIFIHIMYYYHIYHIYIYIVLYCIYQHKPSRYFPLDGTSMGKPHPERHAGLPTVLASVPPVPPVPPVSSRTRLGPEAAPWEDGA